MKLTCKLEIAVLRPNTPLRALCTAVGEAYDFESFKVSEFYAMDSHHAWAVLKVKAPYAVIESRINGYIHELSTGDGIAAAAVTRLTPWQGDMQNEL